MGIFGQDKCIPTAGTESVWRIQDPLDIYARPYDHRRQKASFDVYVTQLIAKTCWVLTSKPACPERFGLKHRRNGKCYPFLSSSPWLVGDTSRYGNAELGLILRSACTIWVMSSFQRQKRPASYWTT